MVVHSDKFMDVVLDKENNIIEHFWKETSTDLSDNTFKDQLNKFRELIVQYKPKGVTVDTTKFLFPLTPEIQQWVGETFFPPIIAVGVKKYALQVSPDIFAQVSVESVIEEESKDQFITKYFDNLESAKQWVIK